MPVAKNRHGSILPSSRPVGSLQALPQQRWHGTMQDSPLMAYIALGSNVGNRAKNIDAAVMAMNEAGLTVTRTSALYETAPMYVTEQESFLNAVCEVQLSQALHPLELLAKVKDIEDQLGRVKTINKGPRAIDLDIVLYGQHPYKDEKLTIPHHSLLEREFVLKPLADLIPQNAIPGQDDTLSVSAWLSRLEPAIETAVTPLRSSLPLLRPQSAKRNTNVMAILNMTPDSFSDGGVHDPANPKNENLQSYLYQWLRRGVSIFDVGGQSTRPKAAPVTAEEEIARVLPLIKEIRKNPDFDAVAISVDTYRAPVAEAAIRAGADVVNDVSAGVLDGQMLPTVAKLQCPIIMMHMRGDPQTMLKLNKYPNGLIETIEQELYERVQAAIEAGVPRWKIILDPGIGFAKEGKQNLQVLREFGRLKNSPLLGRYPWVVGTSRKRFIRRHLGQGDDFEDADWGTAAAVTACVQGGADILRIHSPLVANTVSVADAIYRSPPLEGSG